jgi:CcmD family protein
MTVFRRVVAIAMLVIGLAGGAEAAVAQTQPPPEQQNEFIPVDQLPPQDQLPAAPLLIGAYAFVVVVLFGYVFSIARRLGTVQREVERLESDMKKSARG